VAINEAADRADFSINEQVIVRALGPTLTNFGITGALADPTLSLLDANGTLLAFNDNWKNTQQAEITASGKAPPDDRESAIMRTLVPGKYTAVVRGMTTLLDWRWSKPTPCSERDVAQRVPKRAPERRRTAEHNRRTQGRACKAAGHECPATATDRIIGGGTTQGQRRRRTKQTSTDSSRCRKVKLGRGRRLANPSGGGGR
jgi:hypothetical protein